MELHKPADKLLGPADTLTSEPNIKEDVEYSDDESRLFALGQADSSSEKIIKPASIFELVNEPNRKEGVEFSDEEWRLRVLGEEEHGKPHNVVAWLAGNSNPASQSFTLPVYQPPPLATGNTGPSGLSFTPSPPGSDSGNQLEFPPSLYSPSEYSSSEVSTPSPPSTVVSPELSEQNPPLEELLAAISTHLPSEATSVPSKPKPLYSISKSELSHRISIQCNQLPKNMTLPEIITPQRTRSKKPPPNLLPPTRVFLSKPSPRPARVLPPLACSYRFYGTRGSEESFEEYRYRVWVHGQHNELLCARRRSPQRYTLSSTNQACEVCSLAREPTSLPYQQLPASGTPSVIPSEEFEIELERTAAYHQILLHLAPELMHPREGDTTTYLTHPPMPPWHPTAKIFYATKKPESINLALLTPEEDRRIKRVLERREGWLSSNWVDRIKALQIERWPEMRGQGYPEQGNVSSFSFEEHRMAMWRRKFWCLGILREERMGAWPYCRKPTEWDMEEAAKRNISASPMDPSKKNIWPKKNAVPPIETERRPDTGYLPRARYSPGQGFTSALPTTTLVPWGVLLPVPAYSFEVRKGSRLREALVFEDEEPPAPTDEEMVDLCTKLAAEILDETELKRSSIEIGDKNSMSIPQVEFSDENIPAKSSIVWDPGYIERTTEILANKDAHAEASSTINARFQH